jgi:hypothetical protein
VQEVLEVIAMEDNVAPDEVSLVTAMETLSQCDGYAVLAGDPQTGEVDAHGPYDGLSATVEADRLRREFDDGGLEDVQVEVVRWHSA